LHSQTLTLNPNHGNELPIDTVPHTYVRTPESTAGALQAL